MKLYTSETHLSRSFCPRRTLQQKLKLDRTKTKILQSREGCLDSVFQVHTTRQGRRKIYTENSMQSDTHIRKMKRPIFLIQFFCFFITLPSNLKKIKKAVWKESQLWHWLPRKTMSSILIQPTFCEVNMFPWLYTLY